jgi:hypothetical protein
MHPYDINIKMDFQSLEHQAKALIKEAKGMQELLKNLKTKFLKVPKLGQLCKPIHLTTALIALSSSSIQRKQKVFLSSWSRSTQEKKRLTLKPLRMWKSLIGAVTSLTPVQNINVEQTHVLNSPYIPGWLTPHGRSLSSHNRTHRNSYLETQEENQDLSAIRRLPSSLGRALQNQLEQSIRQKQIFIKHLPFWMEPRQKKQRITKDDMGQLFTAFPCLMKIKYSLPTEEGKKRTENQKKNSTSKTIGPLFFLNNITQLLFSKNEKGRRLLKAFDRNFYKNVLNTIKYGLQDKIQRLKLKFQEEKGITDNPRRHTRPKSLCHRILEGLGF